MNLIVSVDKNGAIGNGGELLMRIPEDMRNFKRLTLNGTVVMGYNTYISLPGQRPLCDRRNIILTTKDIKLDGFTVCHSKEKLFDLVSKDEKVFIIGGAQVYSQFLQYCERAYITYIDHIFKADTYFPNLDENAWFLEEISTKMEYDGVSYYFKVYKNKNVKQY